MGRFRAIIRQERTGPRVKMRRRKKAEIELTK